MSSPGELQICWCPGLIPDQLDHPLWHGTWTRVCLWFPDDFKVQLRLGTPALDEGVCPPKYRRWGTLSLLTLRMERMKQEIATRSIPFHAIELKKHTNSLSIYTPFHAGGKHQNDLFLVTIFCWIKLPMLRPAVDIKIDFIKSNKNVKRIIALPHPPFPQHTLVNLECRMCYAFFVPITLRLKYPQIKVSPKPNTQSRYLDTKLQSLIFQKSNHQTQHTCTT